MFTFSPLMQDFPRYRLHVSIECICIGFECREAVLGQGEAEVFERDGHLCSPHVRTQRMERYFSFREGMQALCELGARLAPAADDLTQINPLSTGRFGDRFALT